MSNVTLGSSAVAVPVMRHRSTNATSLIIIVSSFVRRLDPLVPAGEIPGRPSDAGSGRCLRAAEPFVETNAPEARLAQRHERALLDPAAVISGFGIAHDHTRIANGLQIAGDNFVERCSFRAGDLDDALRRAARATSATAAATSSAAMGWNRPGEILTVFPSALESAPRRDSRNWGGRMMV